MAHADDGRYEEMAGLFKALDHPLRLHLVAELQRAPTHVGALAAAVGAPPAIVSQQLRILRMRHIVAATRHDGLAVYRVVEPRVVRLLHCMEGAVAQANTTTTHAEACP